MLLAVALGILGFLAAIGLTVFAAAALLAVAGVSMGAPAGAFVAAAGVCAVVRGPLRYGEQLCNHYLAFKVLADVRDKVFARLRVLAPAKLEGRDKGDLVSLITSDVELLEVFFAPYAFARRDRRGRLVRHGRVHRFDFSCARGVFRLRVPDGRSGDPVCGLENRRRAAA